MPDTLPPDPLGVGQATTLRYLTHQDYRSHPHAVRQTARHHPIKFNSFVVTEVASALNYPMATRGRLCNHLSSQCQDKREYLVDATLA